MKTIPLEHGNYYHIYNRGINGCQLFKEKANYEHFLKLYAYFINPVAETYAWVLMKNHFHFLVRILEESEIDFIRPKPEKANIPYPLRKKYKPHQQFGNLFNAYAKAYNNRFNRTGSLFESPFERIPVTDDNYLKGLVYYIHKNPVKSGICQKMEDYMWSSYPAILSGKPTNLKRDKLFKWFGSREDFIAYHQREQEIG
jgi:putative transposase